MKKMKWLKWSVIIWFFLFGCILQAAAFEDTDQTPGGISERMKSIIHTHESSIQVWVKDSIIVESVKAQNDKNTSIEDIKRIDEEWTNGKAEKFAKELQNNSVGRYLLTKIESNPKLYIEAFLCDNQGAVVGEYPKTSDYWQGDEDKFIKCFNNGNGQIYIGPLEFDESTQSYSVQVSVPVLENQNTIGVLVVGLKNIQ